MARLAIAGRVCIALVGLLTLTCGAIHIGYILKDSEDWCVKTNDNKCLGPALAFHTASKGFLRSEVNAPWRLNMFTFTPTQFIDIWTPVIMGLFTLLGFFTKGMRIATVCQSWVATTIWLIVCMLFGQFGYAGNFGIVSGFITSCCCIVTIACYFMVPDHAPAKDMGSYVGFTEI